VPEHDWDGFIDTLRAPLPSTFSFVHTGCAAVHPSLVQARFEALVMSLEQVDGEARARPQTEAPVRVPPCGVLVATGTTVVLRLHLRGGRVRAFARVEAVAAPRRIRPLLWFPERRGWQLDAPRKELLALRSSFKDLRAFIETHVGLGRLNRQEAVSMLPPLLLGVRRGDAVLDMCAAPGSKTVLLLSHLAAPAAGPSDETSRGGVIVANEINPQRCERLRVRLACCRVPGTVVCCAPAQRMPGPAGAYDRVLCDVPCSGDGTLRKNPDIWDSWQPRYSATLHPLQLAILTRGLQLLKPGGLLLYSTCSFSPVENEAVVAAALRHCSGVELEDVHGTLPPLRTAAGLSRWRVTAGEDGCGVGSWEEADEERRLHWRLQPSLFAPTAAEAEAFALHRCARLLPHSQDTGGFFVALLRKSAAGASVGVPECAAPLLAPRGKPEPAAATATDAGLEATEATADPAGGGAACVGDAETGAEADEGGAGLVLEPALRQLLDSVGEDEAAAGGGAGGRAEKGRREAGRGGGAPLAGDGLRRLSFTPVGAESAVGAQLREFFGLGPHFPFAQLLSASRGALSRRLYLTSAGGAAAAATPGLRVVAAGVKVLECDSSLGVGCSYRLTQEGALLMLPFLSRRVLRVSPATLAAMLRAKTLSLPYGGASGETGVGVGAGEGEAAAGPAVEAPLDELEGRLAAVRPNGSVLLACENGDGTARCAVVMMKFSDKACLYISEGERALLLDDLGAYHLAPRRAAGAGSPQGADPPLLEQLRPLPTAELARRAALGDVGAGAGRLAHEEALRAAACVLERRPRAERRAGGAALPPELARRLLLELGALRWERRERPALQSEGYPRPDAETTRDYPRSPEITRD